MAAPLANPTGSPTRKPIQAIIATLFDDADVRTTFSALPSDSFTAGGSLHYSPEQALIGSFGSDDKEHGGGKKRSPGRASGTPSST